MNRKTFKFAKKSGLLLIHWLFSVSAALGNSVSVGRHGMVVSAQHLATQVGVNVLKQGGNAVDAAVAVGYALAVVEPCCGNLGGGGFMMVSLADGTQSVINFREKSPSGLTAGYLEKQPLEPSFRRVGVPGTVKGLNAALSRYGTLPLNQLIQPAIGLAEKGFILKQQDVQFLTSETDSFRQHANVASIFLNRGRAYQVGERLIQKQLGNTLRMIGTQGDEAFYQGAIARAIVSASHENGGLITQADLKNYSVTFEKPLVCRYRGYPILTTPWPSVGGAVLCQLLTIMQGFPLKEYGYGSLKTMAANLEAIRHVYEDKNTYSEKPTLMSESEADIVRKKIQSALLMRHSPSKQPSHKEESLNTTAYLVADAKGNWVAVTYSLNGPFGAKVIAGQTGFFLNNQLKDFSYGKEVFSFLKKLGYNPNSPAMGKRPLSYMTQVFLIDPVTRAPFLALASPGGDTIPTQMLIMIENFLDYKMGLKASVDAPRFHFRWQKGTAHLEPEWIAQGRKAMLESIGYRIGKGSGTELGLPYWGAMAGIYMNPKGMFEGAIDWRRPAGMAKGY